MMTLRLRILKRHSSIELPVDEFYRAEFRNSQGQPDLELSVFDIAPECLVQTHSEFVVSFLSPSTRPRGGLSIDDCDGFDATATQGDTLFDYTRSRHVELRFLRESELRSLAERVYHERSARRRAASRDEVVSYGVGKLADKDREWLSACEQRPEWKKKLADARLKTARS